MNHTGSIIVLAFPDTFVAVSDEWICKFLPLAGLGTREYIKAGHAALVLIDNHNGEARYFDFGRYVTPKGHGRVRGANTDVELEIPFKASLGANSELQNLDEFLWWLDANPLKTHGEGRLIASVCESIDHDLAKVFIEKLQQKGSVRYGAFGRTESNCSRFVTDTILAATRQKEIQKALRFNKLFTPSTVGNVEKATTTNTIYEVRNGEICLFNGSAFKENITNYFHKNRTASEKRKLPSLPKNAQKLTGTGSNAWFEVVSEKLPENLFRIRRYNDLHAIDFDGVYRASEIFNPTLPFEFTYDSHCAYCHILQKNKKIKLKMVAAYAASNSWLKAHSA